MNSKITDMVVGTNFVGAKSLIYINKNNFFWETLLNTHVNLIEKKRAQFLQFRFSGFKKSSQSVNHMNSNISRVSTASSESAYSCFPFSSFVFFNS